MTTTKHTVTVTFEVEIAQHAHVAGVEEAKKAIEERATAFLYPVGVSVRVLEAPAAFASNGGLSQLFVVRDVAPELFEGLSDMLFVLEVNRMDDYIRGCPAGAWAGENHEIFAEPVAAAEEACRRARKLTSDVDRLVDLFGEAREYATIEGATAPAEVVARLELAIGLRD